MRDTGLVPVFFKEDVARSHTFPRTHRLRSREDFRAILDARRRVTRGPLVTYGHPNKLEHSRVGIMISRRVGTAVRRNRIKRLLRESYRLLQHQLPGGYDWVIVVRPHAPLTLAQYQQLLSSAAMSIEKKWNTPPSKSPRSSE